MPEISRFFGIIIAMFYNDHEPAHMHVVYGDYRAKVDIANGEIIEGKLPRRVLGLVREWRQLHQDELARDWQLARGRKPLQWIEPLE